MNELQLIIEMSRIFGMDVDMVQAGGGNISAKLCNRYMYIKTSGSAMSTVERDSFVLVNIDRVINILRDKSISKLENRDDVVAERLYQCSNVFPLKRPSIETFIHALLGKIVVHLHPVYVNALTCLEGGSRLVESIFRHYIKSLWIEYENPGYPLGILLMDKLSSYMKNYQTLPEVIFLENHGIIYSSDKAESIYLLNNIVLNKLKKFWGGYDVEPIYEAIYSEGNYVSLVKHAFMKIGISDLEFYMLDSDIIKQVLAMSESASFFIHGALYPDQIVYCGIFPLYILDTDYRVLTCKLKDFIEKFSLIPKVVVFDRESVILCGKNMWEITAIKETLIAHLKVLLLIKRKGGTARFLSYENSIYIANWESEKYRKKCIVESNNK